MLDVPGLQERVSAGDPVSDAPASHVVAVYEAAMRWYRMREKFHAEPTDARATAEFELEQDMLDACAAARRVEEGNT